MCGSLVFLGGVLFFLFYDYTVDFSSLAYYNPGSPSILLDDAGNEWGRFQLDKREPVSLAQLPQHLIDAFIASEDWQFYYHHGISYKGILRSIFVNIVYGCKMQGASTITQQLVKLMFFNAKKVFSRKLQEQFYAILVEQQFTKDQILQIYLNHIYFGGGIYGIEAASRRFWGKPATELSVDESAILAGIVCSPSRYCPLFYPLSAKKRRDIVLRAMARNHFLTTTELENALAREVVIQDTTDYCCAPHVKETIRIMLEKKVGKIALYTEGFVIQTTLNIALQQSAEKIFCEHISLLKKQLLQDIDGALISISSSSGAIKALVGGVDFSSSKFNRALQSRRQMGSTIKPLIYAAALHAGKSFDDSEYDEPIALTVQAGKLWKPRNYNRIFAGKMTLAHALSHSNNIVAIKTLLSVGADKIVNLAQSAGITGPFHTYPSLALGCIDATLQEVVGMFNIFNNKGIFVEPYVVEYVKDRWGKKVWRHEEICKKVLDAHLTSQVAFVLRDSIERYFAAHPKERLTGPIISKTGTTNDSRTCWYVGSIPDYTTAVYVGCDDNRSMGKNVFPRKTSFPIWLQFSQSPSLLDSPHHLHAPP